MQRKWACKGISDLLLRLLIKHGPKGLPFAHSGNAHFYIYFIGINVTLHDMKLQYEHRYIVGWDVLVINGKFINLMTFI